MLSPAVDLYSKYVKKLGYINYENNVEFIKLKKKSLKPTIFIDISSLIVTDHGGGIQRVQKSLVKSWSLNPVLDFDIAPIYFSESENRYLYVNPGQLVFWKSRSEFKSGIVEMSSGDIYFNTDLNYNFAIKNQHFYELLHENKIYAYFMIYDLLPLSMPNFFPTGISTFHEKWFKVAVRNAKLLCISTTVANEVIEWGAQLQIEVQLDTIMLGSNLPNLLESKEEIGVKLPDYKRMNFLIVSTIEVRKGHEQVLDAFEILWSQGIDITLTFVGRRGWKVEELLKRIESHKYISQKLFWFDKVNDQQLIEIYQKSTALINASIGEGFGLPLVEATTYALPLILRDIPVFREIAGDNPWYFATKDSHELAVSLESWIAEYLCGNISPNELMKITSWQDTCNQIVDIFRRDRRV